jgi:hypothetical protein
MAILIMRRSADMLFISFSLTRPRAVTQRKRKVVSAQQCADEIGSAFGTGSSVSIPEINQNFSGACQIDAVNYLPSRICEGSMKSA